MGSTHKNQWILRLALSVFCALVVVFLSTSEAWAISKFWVGSSGGSFASNSNWSTSSGGANNTTAPGTLDVATFDAGDVDNCVIDSNIDVSGILIASGYSGTITQNNSYTINIRAGNYNQAGGTFTGGDSTISLTGLFTLSGGTFTSTAGNFTTTAGFTHTLGGTFNHNNGTVTVTGGTDVTFNFDPAVAGATSGSFYNLTLNKTTNWQFIVALGDTLTVNGDLTLTEGRIMTGIVDAKKNVTHGTGFDGGTGTLKVSSADTLTINLTSGVLPTNFTVNAANAIINTSTSGTTSFVNLTIQNGTISAGANNLNVTGDFILSGGTFNASTATMVFNNNFTHTAGGTFTHNNGTVTFDDSTLNINTAVTSSGVFYNLTKNTTGTLTIANDDVVYAEGATNLTDGTVAFNNAGSFLRMQGDVTVTSTYDGTLEDGFEFYGSAANQNFTHIPTTLNNNWKINKASGTVTMLTDFTMQTGNSNALVTVASGTLDMNGYNLTSYTYSQSGGTFNNGSSSFTTGNSFTLSGGTFNATTATMSVGAGWVHNIGGTFNHNNGTVILKTGALDVNSALTGSGIFYNLTKNTASTVTIANDDIVVVQSTANLTDGAIGFGNAGSFLRMQGDVIVAATYDGTLEDGFEFYGTTANQNFTHLPTTLNNNWKINKASGTVTMLSDFTMQTSNSNALVTVASGTLDMNGYNFTSYSFSQTGGIFNSGSGSFTTGNSFTLSGGTFNATTGTMTVGTAWTHTTGGTFNHNNNTVILKSGTIDVNSGLTGSGIFYNLTKNTSGTLTIAADDIITVQAATILNDGAIAFNNAGSLFRMQGDVTLDATYDATGTVGLQFYGSAVNQNFTNSHTTLNNKWNVNKASGTVTMLTDFTMQTGNSNATLTITSGTLDLNGYNLTVYANATAFNILAAGTLKLQGGETINQTPVLNVGSTVYYKGTAASYTLKDYAYSNLAINGGATTIFALPTNKPSMNTVTITSGILDCIGYNFGAATLVNDATLRIQGGQNITITTMDADSGTVEYTGTSTYNKMAAGAKYYHLKLNGSGGNWTLGADTLVNGSFSNLAGTINLGGKTMTVGGDWTNNDIFTHANGTVIFKGNTVSIAGTNTFYKLTYIIPGGTLTFPNGNTTIIASTLTAYGTSGSKINFRSSSDGNAATVNYQGVRIIQYLDVKDNNNSNATAVSCYLGCANSGGNTNWNFVPSIAGTTQTWDFNEATPANVYTFNNSLLDVNVSSNSLVRLKDLGSGARAASIMPDYTRRQIVTVTNGVGSVLTNYPVRLAVTYDADMQADFDDIRFTLSDGTAVNYWLESKINSTSAVFWIKVPSLPSSGNTKIHMYYGNGSVSTLSNGANTFITFDDFSNGSTLSNIWTTKNTDANKTIAQASGVVTLACNTSASSDWWTSVDNAPNLYLTAPPGDFSVEVTLTAYTANATTEGGLALVEAWTGNDKALFWGRNANSGLYADRIGTNIDSNAITDIPVRLRIRRVGTTKYFDYSTDAGATWTNENSTTYTTPTIISLFQKEWGSTAASSSFDHFMVRPYNATEPTTAFAAEETTYSYNDVKILPAAGGVHPAVTSLQTFSETLGPGNQGFVTYQVGLDSNLDNTVDGWYWYNGTAWTAVVNDTTDNNVAAFVNAYAADFKSQVGSGNFYFKAFPVSDGVQAVEIDSLSLIAVTPTVTVSAATQSVAESVGTVTVTAALNESFSQNITVPFTVSGTAAGTGTDHNLADGNIVITAGAVSGTTNFTVTNDSLYEASETVIVTLGTPNNSAVLGATTVQTITITDNDTAPTIQFATTTSNAVESTANPNIAVSLSGASGANTTVNYAITGGTATGSGTDYTLASGTLTINAGNTSGNITPTIVNDNFDEDDETIQVTISSPGNATLAANTVHTYTITDNDATPTLSVDDVSVNETEANVTASFTVTLSAASGKTVTVDYATSANTATAGTDYTSIGTTTLTYTPGQTTKTINVTVLGDALDEDDETYNLNLSNAGNATISDASGVGTIADNDATPTVTFSAASQTVAEDVGSVTVTASLSAVSGRTITVPYTVSGSAVSGTDHNLANGNISITTGVSSGNKNFTVTNDAIDENDETTILTMGSPTNATASGTTVHTLTITDNDTVGVTVTQSGGSTNVTEGSNTADTYTVVLNSQPSADVTITISSGSQLSADQSTLTFTSGNWDQTQTVSVLAVNDSVAESAHTGSITHGATSSDAAYHGITITGVTGNVTDNDTASISIIESSGSTAVAESGVTDTYTVVLTSQPSFDVTVALSPNSQVSVSPNAPASLTFTSGNWSVAQTVTISAINDNVAEGSHSGSVSHTTSSSDANYNNLSVSSVNATISDNDAASVTITESGGGTSLAEGGVTDAYTIILTSQPTGNVTVTIGNTAQASTNVTSLIFTSANWNSAQTITITAINDNVAEGNHNTTMTHTAASSDTNYNNISIGSVVAAITDNDAAGITVAHTGGTTTITEGGSTDTYTIVLTSQPANDVTITPTYDGQITLNLSSLIFTSANWNAPQSFTVTALNDNIAEGNHSSTISHAATSSDGNYNGIGIGNLVASLTDNDSSGVTITQSGGVTAVTEGGTTDTYTMALTSQPTSNVTITLGSNSQLSSNVSSSLAFTTSNWSVAQTITVTAINDNVAEGNHNSTLTCTASSSDSSYNGITIGSISVAITDNDAAGVSLSESSGSTAVTEGGSQDSYSLVLTSQPSASVIIDFNPADPLQVTPEIISFTTSNWNVAQTVSVGVISALVQAGQNTATIVHEVTSSDANYHNIGVNQITVTVTSSENDVAENNADDDAEGADTEDTEGSENQAPTVSVEDFSVVELTTVQMKANASDPDGDNLTYEWAQSLTDQCHQSITPDEIIDETLVLTIPQSSKCFAFTVTVSDGELTASATATVSVLKKMATVTKTPVIENTVIAGQGNTIITANKTNNSSLVTLDLGNGVTASTDSLEDISIVMGDTVIIGDPHYDNNTGRVISIDTDLAGSSLDLTSDNLVQITGVNVTKGQRAGDLFGYKIIFGDVDSDDENDLFVLSPGSTFGNVYILDGTTLEIKNLMIGSDDERFKLALMTSADFNGDAGDEAVIGIQLNGANASENRSLTVDANISVSTSAFNGLLASNSLPDVIDFSENDPDFTVDSDKEIDWASQGDVDGNGLSDLILASSDNCEVFIYFGNTELGVTETALVTENTIPCTEDTNFTSFAVSDVTGDGIDDIILGFSDVGRIYVLTGKPQWNENDYDMDDAIVIDGGDSSAGAWLVIGDYNNDGVNDIYTNSGESGQSTVIILASLDDSVDEGAVDGNGFNFSGGSCSLTILRVSQAPTKTTGWIISLLLLPVLGLWRLRSVKFGNSVFAEKNVPTRQRR